MVESKNFKLKLGLCGLALTSFLALNTRSNTVHADTVNGGNASAITWDVDNDDSQVVKEDSEQVNASQSVQTQGAVQSSVQKQEAPAIQSVQSSVQNHAETSTVRVSNFDTSAVNRNNAQNVRAQVNQVKVSNVNATIQNTPVQIVNPQNNIVRVNFVKTNGQNTNLGSYDIDVSTDNGNSYKLPDGYALANSNEHYNIERSNHKFYVYNGMHTYNGIDPHLSNITFESTLNPNLQNKLQMTVDMGDAPRADRDGSKSILYLYNEVPLKANFSIYGVPRSNIEATAAWDIANSTAIANKMGLSYDQLKALVFNAVYDPSTNATRWMRMNAILDKTTTSVDHKYSFSDPDVKSIVGNTVNVPVIKPQSVDPNSAQCKKQATRVIHIAFPNGVKPESYDSITDSDGNKLTLDSNNNLTQTVTFTRSVTVDSLTGATLNQTPWKQHGAINAVTLPDIPGYTMTQS